LYAAEKVKDGLRPSLKGIFVKFKTSAGGESVRLSFAQRFRLH